MRSENNSPTIFFILIAIIIISIAIFFQNHFQDHFQQTRKESHLVGKRLPTFSLPSLSNSTTIVTDHSLAGHVFLLNIWASWCQACQAEHSTLLMIANTYHVPIYGVAYKDNSQNAKNWLQVAGDPYALVALDSNGSLGNKFGLYGTPETFVVDKHGMIRYRYIGVLKQTDWETILRPLIEKYQDET